MSELPDQVTIKLDRPVALALFEWVQRFTERRNPQFTHRADAIAIALIAEELEWELPEVLTPAYPELLHRSRKKVVAEYLGKTGLDWLDELSFQDRDSREGT